MAADDVVTGPVVGESALAVPAAGGGAGARDADGTDRPAARASSPEDLISMVPWLLGFRPRAGDIVVVGSVPPRGRVTLTQRWNLPDPPDEADSAVMARHAAAVLAAQGCTHAAVAAFGPDRLAAPAAALVLDYATRAGLTVTHLLRADGGRYWHLPRCSRPACPPDGTPYATDGNPVTIAHRAAGMPEPLASRDVLAATIAPASGAEAEAMHAAIRRAKRRASRNDYRSDQRHHAGARRPTHATALGHAVRTAIEDARHDRTPGHDELALLAVALMRIPLRDLAWGLMDPAHQQAHQQLWTRLTRLTPPALGLVAAAPASLLAFTAWQAGNGALANIALDQAQAADPGYSMAQLLREILAAGVDPSRSDPAAAMQTLLATWPDLLPPGHPAIP